MHCQAHRFNALYLLVFLYAALSPDSIQAQRQSLHLPARQIVLQKLFREITKQTGLPVFYSDVLIDDKKTISFSQKRMTLSSILDSIVVRRPLRYEIKSDCIVFSAEVNKKQTIPEPTDKQPGPAVIIHELSGVIVDENNSGVAGVNIAVKGGKTIAVTDLNGEFFLSRVTDGERLIFSAITIDSFETTVTDKRRMFLKAKSRISLLQEVVVNKGYYTERKKLSAGNSARIGEEEIRSQTANNPLSLLQGRVAGLMVTPTSGVPGTGYDVIIRGQASFTSKSVPLYLVDGVPYLSQMDAFKNTSVSRPNGMTELPSALYFLNTNDIISMDVLKDADASAIYGARGANGVILITTRKAKEGKMHLNADISGGFGKVGHFTKMLNVDQYIAYRKEALQNDRKIIGPNDYDLNGVWKNTEARNWNKLFRGNTAWMNNANLSLSGGTGIFKFLCSGGYSREGNVVPGDFHSNKKFFHNSLEIATHNKKLSFTYTTDVTTVDSRLPQSGIIATSQTPLSPPLYTPNGQLNWQRDTFFNPLADITPHLRMSVKNLLTSINAQYLVNQDIRIKLTAGLNSMRLDDLDANPTTLFGPSSNMAKGYAYFGFNTLLTKNIEPQIEYVHSFQKIKLSAIAGYSYMHTQYDGYTLNATGYTNDDLLESIAAAANITPGKTLHTDYKYNAVFARLNTNWQDRYILNMTARRDGSSRFGSGNKFANFWSLAGGWIFASNRKKPVIPALTFGKIRASYGLTGNDQIGDYKYQNIYNYLNYPLPYQGSSGLYPAGLPNKDITWEKTYKTEVGLELSFFKDRVAFSTSYFSNNSGSLLATAPLPGTTGFGSVVSNIDAIINNRGWEWTLGYKNQPTSRLQWNSFFNVTTAKNLLKDFPGLASSPYRANFIIGKPTSVLMAFDYAGVDPQTGLYSFVDAAGRLTSKPDYTRDKTAVIVSDPSFYGGWYNTFRYKQFGLDIFIHFVKQMGLDPLFFNNASPGQFFINQNLNWPVKILDDHWQKPGDIATVQKFSTDPNLPMSAYKAAQVSARAYTDASFVRIKSIVLSYSLNKKSCDRLRIDKIQFYLETQNLFTITRYIGNDPETQGDITPQLRTILLGIRMNM